MRNKLTALDLRWEHRVRYQAHVQLRHLVQTHISSFSERFYLRLGLLVQKNEVLLVACETTFLGTFFTKLQTCYTQTDAGFKFYSSWASWAYFARRKIPPLNVRFVGLPEAFLDLMQGSGFIGCWNALPAWCNECFSCQACNDGVCKYNSYIVKTLSYSFRNL